MSDDAPSSQMAVNEIALDDKSESSLYRRGLTERNLTSPQQ